MSDDPENPPAPSGIEQKVDKLAEQVSQLFAMFSRGEHDQGSETNPETSMSAEVRAELEKLKAEEARQQRETERDQAVTDLTARMDAIPERAPREYRRSTNLMRWATEADR